MCKLDRSNREDMTHIIWVQFNMYTEYTDRKSIILRPFFYISLNKQPIYSLLLCSGSDVLKVDELQDVFIKSSLRPIMFYLQSDSSAIRYVVSRIIGSCANVQPVIVIDRIIDPLLELLDSNQSWSRKGGVEAIAQIVQTLKDRIVPFTVIFVVPILKLMSDHDKYIRQVASFIFGRLVQLMPLEQDGSKMSSQLTLTHDLEQRRVHDRKFLEQLFDNSKCEPFKIIIPYSATLRDYQQDGVNWLMFLNRFGLHGILSDEMGLGKTLQTIIAVASDHCRRSAEGLAPLPSMVVSPPSVTGHWFEEIQKFVPDTLKVLHYTGSSTERKRLQKMVEKHNLIVASYEVVRNDVEFFKVN